MATFTPGTGHPKWIGYQVLTGFGFGLGMQLPLLVIQTILDKSDVATGTAVMMFFRFLGSAVFLPVAQSIFLNSLVSGLTDLPEIDPSRVTGSGVTNLRSLASGRELATLLSDYNDALVSVLYMVAAACAVCAFGAVLVEWRSLKDRSAEQEKSDSAP